MTALFAGLTTLDVLHRLDHVPDPLLKVTSTDFTMAAGGPATNAAVTYAALCAASRVLNGSGDEAGAASLEPGSPGRGRGAADTGPCGPAFVTGESADALMGCVFGSVVMGGTASCG